MTDYYYRMLVDFDSENGDYEFLDPEIHVDGTENVITWFRDYVANLGCEFECVELACSPEYEYDDDLLWDDMYLVCACERNVNDKYVLTTWDVNSGEVLFNGLL